jgi:two-component SAPR family response regulator
MLLLDEIDRLWEGQTAIDTQSNPVDIAGLANALLIALVRALPADFRVFLCTRSLDYAPWQDLIADGLARPAFTPPGPLVPRLDVYAFGTGIVYADSKRVAYWDGLLPQSIFFFFMDKPLLTREEIFQAFWPDMTARDATNVFHVIKRKIAERVNYDPIVYGMGRYHRSPDISIYYDVAEFEACVNRFYENPDDIQSMERAVNLRRAPFMHGYKQPWAVERRRQLDGMYIDALIGLGTHYGGSDPTRALAYFQRAAHLAPTREDINRQVIQRHAELGQIDAAIAQYQVLEKALQTAFGITPDRATRELYQKISTYKHVQ